MAHTMTAPGAPQPFVALRMTLRHAEELSNSSNNSYLADADIGQRCAMWNF
ncbi:MAG: hypothetical protein ACI807_003595 [Paracoccaceae bacterium]|jgi:hypothetical protein